MAGSSSALVGRKRAWCWKQKVVVLGLLSAKEEFLPSRRQRWVPVAPEILWMEQASRAEMR